MAQPPHWSGRVGGAGLGRAARRGFHDTLTRKSSYWRFACTEFAREIAEVIPAGAILLDCGAGQGEYRQLFGRQRYISIDFDPKFRTIAAAADVNHLPFRSGSIDAVLANNVFEHISTPHLFAGEIARVLKPGGTVYVLVPFLLSIHQEPVDFFRYTEYGLRTLLSHATLVERRLERVGGLCAVQGHVLPVLMRRMFERLERKPFGRATVRLLNPVWKEMYYRVVLPTLARLDVGDTHQDYALGYFAVFEKAH